MRSASSCWKSSALSDAERLADRSGQGPSRGKRHRGGPRFGMEDRLDRVDPAGVALVRAPEPVLAAPEEDRAEPGVLQVREQATDRLRTGALRIGKAVRI